MTIVCWIYTTIMTSRRVFRHNPWVWKLNDNAPFFLTVWAWAPYTRDLTLDFFIQMFFGGDYFEKMQHIGSAVVAAELCVSSARSACRHLNLRVKEDNFTKEKYVTPFTEILSEVQPFPLDLTTKTNTVSIISFKNASCYYMRNAYSKKVESERKYTETRQLQVKPRKKQWHARAFVKDHSTQNKLYISLFHSHIVKLFNVHAAQAASSISNRNRHI